jgi:hypothetical protein
MQHLQIGIGIGNYEAGAAVAVPLLTVGRQRLILLDLQFLTDYYRVPSYRLQSSTEKEELRNAFSHFRQV